jgi:hypothetical protein
MARIDGYGESAERRIALPVCAGNGGKFAWSAMNQPAAGFESNGLAESAAAA